VNLVYAEAARATAELRGGGPPDGVPRQSVEFEQLPGHLAAKIALGEGRLQLQVTPPQYGTLDVDVRLQDGALFVSLRAESAAVVQHLERHLQDLGAQLESAGLTLGGMDLSARDAPGDAQAGNGAFGTADTAGTAGESFARSRSSRGPATSSQTRFGPDAAETLSPRRLGGIDVIA
jgi:flagellar hook-length control protein FliK